MFAKDHSNWTDISITWSSLFFSLTNLLCQMRTEDKIQGKIKEKKKSGQPKAGENALERKGP